jgi:hypothetical protein
VSPAVALACLAAAVAAAGAVALVAPPATRLRARLGQTAATARASVPAVPRSAVDAVVGVPLRGVGASLGRRLERRSDDALRLALRQAGLRATEPDEHRARIAASAALGGVVGGVLAVLVLHSAPLALAAAVTGVVAGAARSRGRLDRLRGRRERIRLELVTVDQLRQCTSVRERGRCKRFATVEHERASSSRARICRRLASGCPSWWRSAIFPPSRRRPDPRLFATGAGAASTG